MFEDFLKKVTRLFFFFFLMTKKLSFPEKNFRWKYFGACFWSLTLYIAFEFITLIFFGANKTKIGNLLGLILLFPDIYLYMKSLKVLPVPSSVLRLNEVSFRFGWFLNHWLFEAAIYSSFLGIKQTFIYSFFTTWILYFTLQFSIFIPEYIFKEAERQSRLDQLLSTYKLPIVPLITIFSLFIVFDVISLLFYQKFSLCLIIGLVIYLLSDMTCRICEIIMGEPISFDSKDSPSRLAEGMQSRDDIFRYWAYSDLLLSSIDQCNTRRKHLFRSGGECFFKVLDAMRDEINKYKQQDVFAAMEDEDPSHYSLTRLRDSTLSKDQRYKILDTEASRKKAKEKSEEKLDQAQKDQLKKESKTLKHKILEKLGISTFLRHLTDNDLSKREKQIASVREGVNIIELIRAIHFLIYYADKENDDPSGFLQAYIEEIIDGFLSISRVTKNMAHHLWLDIPYQYPFPRYNAEYIAASPRELTKKVYDFVNEFLNQVLAEYGSKIETSKISKENEDEFTVYNM